nr:MAG TPA: hypothetical protein [Caudoviricetes sp.]
MSVVPKSANLMSSSSTVGRLAGFLMSVLPRR